jgi:hypothetical protein
VLVRSSVVVALLAAPAAADAPDDVPGTGGDPILALTTLPQYVDAPLFPGLSIRGADPEGTRVLFDGFEVPAIFHDGRGLRSVFIADGLQTVFDEGNGVGYGRGTSFLALVPRDSSRRAIARVSDVDATVAAPFGYSVVAARQSWPLESGEYASFDGSLYAERKWAAWAVSTSLVSSQDRGSETGHNWARFVIRTRYRNAAWALSASASPLWSCVGDLCRDSYDAKLTAEHTAPAAGLERVKWGAGLDSINSRYDLDHVFWRPELGAYSYVEAKMAPNIVARGGVRIEAFDNMRDIATQPRATIEAKSGDSSLILQAGAYRRPPEKEQELLVETLHPERTTQVTLTARHARLLGGGAIGGEAVGYYIDRTRLVARDAFDNWGNTGTGTSKGVEAAGFFIRRPWSFYAGVSLSSSVRRDFPRGREYSADFDQPVRIDSVVRYSKKRWQLGVRFSLSSGLPYTPVVESTYDNEADAYVPVYGFANAERLPWMHSFDIRADIYIGRGFRAFAELRNAYAASTALGYEYSFDYKDRFDVTLPILPFVGLSYVFAVRRPAPREQPVIASEDAQR